MALEVVRRAALQPNERVLDIGTGTGTAAAAALGDGRRVTGIDGAAGMLEIARRDVPAVQFEQMDFSSLSFERDQFDVVLAAHALHFAEDRSGALAEWRRVTRPGGRLSLSVPGPEDVMPASLYREIYDRHRIGAAARYFTPASLTAAAEEAGWDAIQVEADPTTSIVLRDEDAFRTWRESGSRSAATDDFTPAQHRALTDEMLAVTPRGADGSYRIPFGALYLTARRDS